jgi:hypothetical protein
MALGLSAILGLGSAVVGAASANKAAKAGAAAADRQADIAEEQFNLRREDLAPYRSGGQDALAAAMFELGLGPRPEFGGTPQQINEITENIPGTVPAGVGYTSPEPGMPGGYYDSSGRIIPGAAPGSTRTRFGVGENIFDDRAAAEKFAAANPTGATPYQGFQKTPGYDFALQEGTNAIEAGAAARGGLYSGRTMQDLQQRGIGHANQEYGNYLNRILGMTDMGMGAAAMDANSSNAFAAQASQAAANKGNAQMAGAIGVGNAFQGGFSNLASAFGYQQNQQQPQAKPWWHGT